MCCIVLNYYYLCVRKQDLWLIKVKKFRTLNTSLPRLALLKSIAMNKLFFAKTFITPSPYRGDWCEAKTLKP